MMKKEQRPFGELMPYEEALDLIMENVQPIKRKEKVNVDDSFKRVLAEDVMSEIFVPPFERAAMDGYAVKAEDTFGAEKFDPVELECIDELHAGDVPRNKIDDGKCIQIATGAPLPEGADAVVKVERTERDGGSGPVRIYKPVHPGENVSPKGEDIEEGELVLEKDKVLTSSKVGALAAMGKEEVEVYEKPAVGIIPTGDEVVPLGQELEPGKIYDVNSHTLRCVVGANGGEPVSKKVVQDTIEGLKGEIKKEVKKSDMVLFSGGSSVGDKDILIDALASLGEVIFHGVKIKPGKPTLYGIVEDTPVIGMPGYPTSCLNTAQQLIKPALRKMARQPEPPEKRTEAVLQKRITSSLGRRQYMTVRLEGKKAYPVYKQSGAITSMARADGYFMIAENKELVENGEKVSVVLY